MDHENMFEHFKDNEDFKEKNGYVVDDVWYPRVTRIVGIKAKPALYYFYGEAANFKAGQEISQKSAEEGTMVHEAVESIMMGNNPEIPEVIQPAVEGFIRFAAENNIQASKEYMERRIHHPYHRYAGTIDAIALIGGKFGVLDIKTSQGIYRDYNLQTAAYIEALKDELPNLQTRWILRIDQGSVCQMCGATRRVKGGREKIKLPYPRYAKSSGEASPRYAKSSGKASPRSTTPCAAHTWGPVEGIIELQEFPYWKNDFEAFLGAKRLWEWENEHWLKKVGYL